MSFNPDSPVLFLWLLSLVYILVKGEDEEERASVESSAAWDDDEDDEHCVIREFIFCECKEQSLQM